MKLSIIILFCDRDYNYLPYLLDIIHDRVSIDHEVVLIDNRENNHDEIDTTGCIYYSFGFNATQVQGRKKGIELATGDYIWFVDGDDEIVLVTSLEAQLMEHDYDIIHFGGREEKLQTTDILNYGTLNTIGVMLWNKWIKTSILRQVEELIPTDLYGSASEDTMLTIGSMKFSKTIYHSTKRIYIYIRERSCAATKKIESVAHYQRIINGYDKVFAQIVKMLDKNEQDLIRGPGQKGTDCKWFIEKLAICTDEIRGECAQIFCQYFTPEEFRETWLKYSITASLHVSKEEYDRLKTSLKQHMPEAYRKHLDARSVIKEWGEVNGQKVCRREIVQIWPRWDMNGLNQR